MTYLRVREIAQGKGMNITDLSRKALISYTTAHSLWHDKTNQLNRSTLDRVALALGVNVSELFGGNPELQEVTEEETQTLRPAAA